MRRAHNKKGSGTKSTQSAKTPKPPRVQRVAAKGVSSSRGLKKATSQVAPPSARLKAPRKGKSKEGEFCHHCGKNLVGAERALFVEEEVGRIFCSEDCITGYFAPEIKRLEKEYLRKLSPRDLSGEGRERLAHLRWATLQKPDEVWREKTLTGDYRYTLISKFSPKGQRPVWCVCICLFLRGDPSFLYLAFPTQNSAMANHFRKGEQIAAPSKSKNDKALDATGDRESESTDRLASSWTEDDLLQAELRQARRKDDIPREQFEKYLKYFEETLESPDEVWSTVLQLGSPGSGRGKLTDGAYSRRGEGSARPKARRVEVGSETATPERGTASEGSSLTPLADSTDPENDLESTEGASDSAPEDKRLYHFLRAYSDQKPILWYIIVARDTDEDEEIEILDSFPTHDESLVHRYRTGRQDVGEGPVEEPLRRVLH
jgi:hypothetical protein